MTVERWEEESDEEWAERLAEEIAIANNTETTQYFFKSGYEEDEIILNYVGKDSWTWKNHPEGPFKATQILEWKKEAELLPIYKKQYGNMVDHALELEDKLEAIKNAFREHYGVGLPENFHASDYDACDAYYLADDIKKIIESSELGEEQ